MTAERLATARYGAPTLADARRQLFPFLKFVLVVAGGIGTALPFIWMVLSSFKTNADIARIPMHWFPAEWMVQNYAKVFEIMPFARFYLNSIIVGVLTTCGALAGLFNGGLCLRAHSLHRARHHVHAHPGDDHDPELGHPDSSIFGHSSTGMVEHLSGSGRARHAEHYGHLSVASVSSAPFRATSRTRPSSMAPAACKSTPASSFPWPNRPC